jgi:hypothetical protein
MPNPSSVSAQNINTELGVSSTAAVTLNDTAVRNLTNKSSGAVSYGDCRWGINIPGGEVTDTAGTTSYVKTYSTSPSINVFTATVIGPLAEAGVMLAANGAIQYRTDTSESGGQVVKSTTWLTSGTNSEYKIRLQTNGATLASGSDAGDTDHLLSTSRYFKIDLSSSTLLDGFIILKDSGGTELFRRQVILTVSGPI